MSVTHINNADELKTKLEEAGEKLVIVDFYATWCGPCKIISPKVDELAKKYTDVIFLKVDVDECEEVAAEYDISAMPTFVFIKHKAKLENFSGANATKLEEMIENLK